ncbi:hypothetical protein ACP4OV_019067 [Aristida adscensionis]
MLQTPPPLARILFAALALKIVVVTKQGVSRGAPALRRCVRRPGRRAAATTAAHHAHRRPARAELAEVERAVLVEEIREGARVPRAACR